MKNPSIVWFSQDLRIEDQPALNAAIAKGGAIIPLYIWAPQEEKEWAPGAASRWWLYGSLKRLQAKLSQLGLNLIIRQQSSLKSILDIVKQTKADAVFWNQRYEPILIQRDALIQKKLSELDIDVQIFNGSLLFEPHEILNKKQKPYQKFGHFWKYCDKLSEPNLPFPKPLKAKHYTKHIDSDSIEHLNLLPTIPWDKGLKEQWQSISFSTKHNLQAVIENIVTHYSAKRDIPGIEGTTRMSPFLHFGEISPRQVWHEVRQKLKTKGDVFLRQLGWRDFAYYLLFHFPHLASQPLRTRFASIPWSKSTNALRAWQKGITGYPIVDAGMRQLWQTGWIHNRARLIVGSFLVKDLLIDWRKGAHWFWDTLVDADLANNSLGWQWITGCGVDAAPYFRIFNPISQGMKFDADGEYVRRWVPEISLLPNKWIHQPWKAPEKILKEASVELGVNYPWPIVDHAIARKKALKTYSKSYSEN